MAEIDAEAVAAPPPTSTKKLIIIVTVAVLVAVGAAVGITLALTGDKSAPSEGSAEATEEEAPPAESMYVELKPEFVINFRDRNDRQKFLKAEMSVSTGDEDVAEAVERHMPAIRNSLVLLLSRQIYEDLLPHEGKEKLRAEALAEVQAVLEAEIGKPGVTDLFFATLVMH